MTLPNTILLGRVGSKAYGLDTPDSDDDYLGIFVAPKNALLGLDTPTETIVVHEPDDMQLHEVGKYCRLALGCNPTLLELLWLQEYEALSIAGQSIIDNRYSFLSAGRVRDAFFGYATQQFHRLQRRGDGRFASDLRKRTAKHARHLHRLLLEGYELYTTGSMTVKLDRPGDVRAFGEEVASGNTQAATDLLAGFEKLFDEAHSPLPRNPARGKINEVLLDIRDVYP